MAPFRDQVAVSTGAGRGMGRAHALRLTRAGAAVVLVNIAAMWEIADEQWDDVVDVNLNGMWHAVEAVAPTARSSWIPRSRSPTRLPGLSVTRRAT
jgi:NAD(P)-dependent dehydrogenase (short-subunit alcohol dehydrogenase family)